MNFNNALCMKKQITLFYFVVLSIFSSFADDGSDYFVVKLNYYNPSSSSGSSPLRPKTPANPPVVYQNGYTIMWMIPDFCHSIVIINPDDEEIVYETTVSENDTQIDFPAWLEGQYEIRFMRDTYYYYGTIEL